MREYPEAFTVSILYILCISIVTSMIGLVVEKNNPSIWIIHFDITLFTIVTTVCYIYVKENYQNIFFLILTLILFYMCKLFQGIITSVYYVIHSWAIRHKRPLYLAIFKPLSILIAVVMGTIFLNDSLYLGWYTNQ